MYLRGKETNLLEEHLNEQYKNCHSMIKASFFSFCLWTEKQQKKITLMIKRTTVAP